MVVDLSQRQQQVPGMLVPDVSQAINVVSVRQIAAQLFTASLHGKQVDRGAARKLADEACSNAFILVEAYDRYATEYERFQREQAEDKPGFVTPS